MLKKRSEKYEMGSSPSRATTTRDAANGPEPSQARRNEEIERQLLEDRAIEQTTVKLLLLGGSESGKSTLAKQMKILHLNGFDEAEIINYRYILHTNVVDVSKELIAGLRKTAIAVDRRTQVLIDDFEAFSKKSHTGSYEFDDEARALFSKLWRSAPLIEALACRTKFRLSDNAEYLNEQLDRICKRDFQPNQLDILYCRIATTGVHESRFPYKNRTFRLIDVGGQKSERRKWIHCFENVTAIMFVVALSGYDESLREDEQENRMLDGLNLFDSILANKYFVKSSALLFLNKKDIFEKKITKIPLTACFPNYTGANTYEEASAFVKGQFVDGKSVTTGPNRRQIYTHFTNATDTRNVEVVFAAAADVVLKKNLGAVGVF